jgi:hypothetical protein
VSLSGLNTVAVAVTHWPSKQHTGATKQKKAFPPPSVVTVLALIFILALKWLVFSLLVSLSEFIAQT